MKIETICFTDLSDVDQERLRETVDQKAALVARAGDQALAVAKRVDKTSAGLVVVVSVTGKPVGVLNTKHFIETATNHFQTEFSTLTEALSNATILRSFVRDRTARLGRPPLFYCAKCKHFSPTKCAKH